MGATAKTRTDARGMGPHNPRSRRSAPPRRPQTQHRSLAALAARIPESARIAYRAISDMVTRTPVPGDRGVHVHWSPA